LSLIKDEKVRDMGSPIKRHLSRKKETPFREKYFLKKPLYIAFLT